MMLRKPTCADCPHNLQYMERLPIKKKGVTMHLGERFCVAGKRARKFKRSDPKTYVPSWCPRLKAPCELRIYGFKNQREWRMHRSMRAYLGEDTSPSAFRYYPIAQAKAWLSGHDKVESCDLLALKNYLWRLPSDREKVEAVLTRLCVNPMQDKVNNIRGMALESQEEFDAALGDGSKADTARKAFIKLRGELTHLYQMQCSLRTAAQSDGETALVDDLLADLEKISRKAHEQTHFTYTTLEEIAALN